MGMGEEEKKGKAKAQKKRKEVTTKTRRHGDRKKRGNVLPNAAVGENPLKRVVPQAPFPKSFMTAPMSRLRSRHRRVLWEMIKGKK